MIIVILIAALVGFNLGLAVGWLRDAQARQDLSETLFGHNDDEEVASR